MASLETRSVFVNIGKNRMLDGKWEKDLDPARKPGRDPGGPGKHPAGPGIFEKAYPG